MDETVRAAWLQAMSDEAGVVLWAADRDFSRFVYLSDGADALWGASTAPLHDDATPFFEAIFPEDRIRLLDDRLRPRIRDGHARRSSEFRFRARDRRTRWVRSHMRPVIEDGEVTGFAGFARDITAEKTTLEEHRQAREELAALFRALPDLVLVLNAEGRYLRVASGDRRQLYRPESELTDRTLYEVLPHETADWFIRKIRETLERDETVNFRYPLEIQGRLEWFDALLVPLDRKRVLWVARTVTDRVELERQLAHASKLDALGQLAGGVAHDFNNVITVIRGTTGLIMERVSDPQLLADLEDIRQAAERASSLTRQLLAFGRQQVLKPEPVVVAEVIERMGRMLARVIGEHIELTIDTGSDGWTTLTDPGQLEQIVANLVLNARDAVGQNPGSIHISVHSVRVDADDERVDSGALEPGEHVLLTVTDTGEGMTPEVLERAFEPFFTTKQAGSGTGLGLSMVYGTVRQSGGHVEIESEAGAGTTARIFLPRADRAAPRAGTSPEPAATPPASILLVEDEVHVRQVVRRFLESAGHRVREAQDGQDALRQIRENGPPDVVISDLIMPRMGGVALLRKLRQERPGLPVLLMSGYTGRGVVSREELAGADGFLSKPFGRVELLRAVNGALARG
ncbi:MAG: response regulator [Gemmatimonadota bacterium]